ncbi:MAG: ABC transporter permease subunit, partial [Chloroflexota bacterium]
YARENWLTRLIRIAIINLAGIPSVVYGLFGLGLFVFFLKFGTSLLSASLTLSIMTLPVIISASEEALRAVPQAFRTVSISLGGTRWQTIRRIVLPQALPGIITGVLLGLERAAGETAPILFTGAAFFLPRLPHSPFDATMALPYHLFVRYTPVPDVILLDDPSSGLDPISTGKVELALKELKKDYTLVLVPHSIQQAGRTADYAAFFLQGELVEYAEGKEIFTHPKNKRTEDYVEGRFG